MEGRDRLQGSIVNFALWFCLLTFSFCLRVPRVAAHSEEAAVSQKTYTGITVDANLKDWVRRIEQGNWSGKMEITKGHAVRWMRAVPIYLNTTTSNIESGAIANTQDLAAIVYTLWDDTQLYVAAVVQDDQVVTQHEGEDIWQDDCVELWLDCRHDAMTHTLFQDDEYQIGLSPTSRYRQRPLAWTWRNPRTEQVTGALQLASMLTPEGYIVEAAVPWRVLHGCKPSIGSMIGMNLSVVDKDEDQLWTHLTWSGQLHSDPSQFGHLYFLDAPVDLFPEDVSEAPPGNSSWERILESMK